MECVDGVIIINLKHRADRLKRMMEDLDKSGFSHQNTEILEATYIPKNGAKGCSHSHYRAIQLAKEKGWNNAMILEDDFKFILEPETVNLIVKNIMNDVPNWDVIMLHWGINGLDKRTQQVHPNAKKVTHPKRGAWTTTGYIVNKKIFDKLEDNFKESFEKLPLTFSHKHRIYNVDTYWQQLQSRHEWLLVNPPVGRPNDPQDSDIHIW